MALGERAGPLHGCSPKFIRTGESSVCPVCYTLLSRHQCLRVGQEWQRALGLLAVMQQTAVLPDGISYSAVISACEEGRQRQQALGFLAVMQQSAVLPNVVSLSTVISACGNDQQWQQALDL